jgi:hypothetical protein
MDGDRKYRQRGYQDNDPGRTERPHPNGTKLPIDVTGPKLPRLVQTIVAVRCYNCAVTLPPDIDFHGNCPKCSAALHCCKQCVNFDSSTRFQCLKPISERIPLKDKANSCTLFSSRVTVARDALPASSAARVSENGTVQAPRSANDARAAFDSLFKK